MRGKSAEYVDVFGERWCAVFFGDPEFELFERVFGVHLGEAGDEFIIHG